MTPEWFNCDHPRTELRKRAIRGGAYQNMRQCLICGESVGSAQKQNGQWLPDWDIALAERIENERSVYWKDKEARKKADWFASEG